MNPAENSFRTAVVGGFNRQDVLNYIESSARESKERVAALQKEAEEAKQAGEAAACLNYLQRLSTDGAGRAQ